MSAELKKLYRDATDFLTFVKLDAPDFSPQDHLTCAGALDRIRRYIDNISHLEESEVALTWLKLCARAVDAAEKLFQKREDSLGRRTLDSARTYLINASGKKCVNPAFIVGNSGQTQDLNSGFPE